jgi:hypothetical protein
LLALWGHQPLAEEEKQLVVKAKFFFSPIDLHGKVEVFTPRVMALVASHMRMAFCRVF